RAEARKNWAGSGEAATGALWFELKEKLEPTEFLGYDTEAAEGVVTALVVDGKSVDQAAPGSEVVVLVNQTPFYAESGGQMGDAGTIALAGGTGGVTVAVRDTQKQAGVLWAHIGTVQAGTLKVGDAVELKVDHARRSAIRANHSATHLLHAALRRRLGEHVTQKGSLVAPERLRFDVSQPRPLTAEDIAVVEAEVNARIRENAEVTTRLMTPEDAIAAGAMALFGEKYGDTVRVVGMGQDGNKVYSQELCGGTHVGRTGDIGVFRLVSEGAVAAGIRRIEAVTGEAAVSYAAHRDTLLADAASALKVTPDELPARLAALVEERRRLEREVADLRRKLATAGSGGAGPEIKEIAGIKFSGRILDDLPARELKPMADALKQQLGSGVVALVGRAEGKLSVCIGVTEDLTGRFDAVALVRAAAEAAGGKGGGGRPDMAQAGGPDAARAGEALAAVEAALAA
ncbi:MAG: alanine--tRNA ligase, partial [Inquilinus limosus]|nr:alanine--tRNA ligase [Inquilinus limosus]